MLATRDGGARLVPGSAREPRAGEIARRASPGRLAISLGAVLILAASQAGSANGAANKAAMGNAASLVTIPGGEFASVLPPAPKVKMVAVSPFRLDRTPVTNAQLAVFLGRHPEWRRDRVARVFADAGYLSHWDSATRPGRAIERQPAVHVSWFAASAYCEARGARLPSWYEWEYAAAASDSQRDGRADPAWRQKILNWYAQPARAVLPAVGATPPNFYGIQDLHGVIWEWVEDLSALLVSADNREQGDPDKLRFCGEGALTMEEKENYTTLMRIAMLSSMQASFTSATMGFRCAVDGAPQ